MKLYLVKIEYGEGVSQTIGVFSTEEKAEDVAWHLVGQGDYVSVEEIETDSLLAYENGYLCSHDTCCDRILHWIKDGTYSCETSCGFKTNHYNTPEAAKEAISEIKCHSVLVLSTELKVVKCYSL